MDVQGEAKERHMEGERERVESSGGALPSVEGLRSPPADVGAGVNLTPPMHDRRGKTTSRQPRGEGLPLVIDMKAARKAVTGFLVVGRLLSPFQANPRVIVDELHATTWKFQGVVTVQEVASDDRRFVINFATEGN
ncbi:Isopenicillin N epimerase [Hordeum vulgare]|nr:Isopenicillin N epimerase [Hordeum vulgare]